MPPSPESSAARPPQPFQYAVIRVVPRIERAEFINAGVIVFCRTRAFLAARVGLDRARLHSLDPGAEAATIEARLAVIIRVAAGEPGAGAIAALPQSERFGWLAAPSSTIVQSSPTHSGLCTEPETALDRLFTRFVGP